MNYNTFNIGIIIETIEIIKMIEIIIIIIITKVKYRTII